MMNIYSKTSFLSHIVSDFKGVRLPYIDDTRHKLYPKYQYHAGIDLYGTNVYSYMDGVVTAIGYDGKTYSVTVEYNSSQCFRYCNLSEVSVELSEPIQASAKIGKTQKYLHFEYVTTSKVCETQNSGDFAFSNTLKESKWSVAINNKVYYKHNPELLQTIKQSAEITIATENELSNGRG